MARSWRRIAVSLTVSTCALLATAMPAGATAVGELDLSDPTFAGDVARMDLWLTFTSPNAADRIEIFEPSVHGSDTLLTAGGTDFSRFSFTPDASVLAGWTEVDPVAGGLFDGVGIYEAPVAGPGLAPGAAPMRLGELAVDVAGIGEDVPLTVTLAGGMIPATNTDLAGVVESAPTSFAPGTNSDASDPAWLVFADANGLNFRTPTDGGGGGDDDDIIPEPATVGTVLLGLLVASMPARRRRRRRG